MLPIAGGRLQAVHWQPNPDLPPLTLAVPPHPYTGDASLCDWVISPSQSGGENIYEAHCNFYEDNGGTGDRDWNELDELPDAGDARHLLWCDYGAWIDRTQPGTAANWAASIPRGAATIKLYMGVRINDSINVYHSPQVVTLAASGYGFFGAGGYAAYPGSPNFWTTVIFSPCPFIFTPMLLVQNALGATIPTNARLTVTGVACRWAVTDTIDTYVADWSAYAIAGDDIDSR